MSDKSTFSECDGCGMIVHTDSDGWWVGQSQERACPARGSHTVGGWPWEK